MTLAPKDDKKNNGEKLTHIDELKQKLYSNAPGASAVRERGLRQHHIDIGKDWAETDEKTAELERREEEARERERLGLATQNALHHGSTQYGHFSTAENLPEYSPQNKQTKLAINTSLAGNKDAKEDPNSIGAFLSDKFANARATKTQKKLAVQDITMKYAAANIEKSIYPNVKDKNEVKDAEATMTAEEVEAERYHPEIKVFSVGNKRLDNMSFENRKASGDPVMARQQKHTEETQEVSAEQKKRSRFGFILFTIISLFFLGSFGYAYYSLQQGENEISAEKIVIQVSGPVAVRSGETSDFTIDITNNNTGDVILSDLVIQYPDGTRSAFDTSASLTDDRIEYGTIKPGQTVRRKASAVFFGEENVKKKIQYTYEFNIEDSATIFTANKDVGVFISSSPVTAKIVNVTEITNNQDLSFDIEVISNSEEIVKDIQLKVEYPFGYSLIESNVKPVADNNTWNIGDIEPLGKKVIKLKGKLIGTSNIEKNFRFTLGVINKNTQQMATVLSTQDQKVLIKKPFVVAELSLDGNTGLFKPVGFDEKMKADLTFTNNLNTSITDVVVEIALSGVLIDRETIKTSNGFYRSTDDVIFWDKAQEPTLALMKAGETQTLNFNLNTLEASSELVRALHRSTSNLVVSIKAKRLNENNVPEEIVSGTTQELRLESMLSLDSGIGYNSGPFVNTGAFPPVVNKETTYTYIGKIGNTANSVKDAVFTAKLPPNSIWKNIYSTDIPSTNVSYSASKREITIKLGDLPSGLGVDKPVHEFAFQLGFTPTLTERGQVPRIVLQPTITAIDTFTNRKLQSSVAAVDIIPRLDSGNVGEGTVE